jgi:drug/metabolite transporter (DMT)-like permease
MPEWGLWWRAGLAGAFLMGGGTGGICFSLKYVTTGTAAVMIGAVPLWATLFAMLLMRYRPGVLELCGIALGFVGVAWLAGSPGGETIGIVGLSARS